MSDKVVFTGLVAAVRMRLGVPADDVTVARGAALGFAGVIALLMDAI